MALAGAGPRKVTVPTLQLIDVLLSEPTRRDWFGLELCRRTGLGSGTVAQILYRLEEWRWLESRWEDAAAAAAQRRPRRRFYRLTGEGERAARELIRRRFPGRLGLSAEGAQA